MARRSGGCCGIDLRGGTDRFLPSLQGRNLRADTDPSVDLRQIDPGAAAAIMIKYADGRLRPDASPTLELTENDTER